jgi:phosphoribosylaminoimidazole-succinocarboxamide synthase
MSVVLDVNDDLPIRTDEPVHSGKVRAVYWLTKEDSSRLIREKGYDVAPDSDLAVMVISDRISAYDCIWHGEGGMNGVPNKGAALNTIASHWFKLFKEKGLADSHILDVPHPLVWIVQKARPVMIEAISRQYITGSMWRDYSKGSREFCGIKIPDGLKNNQKLDKLLLTPSTKGILTGIPGVPEVDDVNISRSDIEKNYKAFNFTSLEHIDHYEKLLTEGYQVISDALTAMDQVFVDTKFEFGYVNDKSGKEKLIYMDEVGTPDSSRIWDGPLYRDSGKVVEKSKEGFRQFLLKHFADPDVFTNKDRMKERAALAKNTALPEAALLEVSKTYTDIAEKITGQKLATTQRPREEIIEVLDKQFGLIDRNPKPLVLIAAGSDSDMPHLETLKKEIGKFNIDAEIRICSAHKQPGRLQGVIAQYNKSRRPIMLVGCAGGTDALSGTASYLSNFPVVSCPPDGMNNTCLTNPPGSSNAFIVKPANIGKFAAQMFARSSPEVAEALDANIAEKIVKLEGADSKLTGKPVDRSLPSFQAAKLAGGSEPPLAVIAAGSDSDMPHLEKLQKELSSFNIQSEIRICSAHKQPGRLQTVIAEYSTYPGPVMMVGCAGGTDALSGTASYLANFPVVSCPPDGMNNTCLTNPPGSSNAFICKPANVAKFAAQMFSRSSKEIASALQENTAGKIRKLEEADEQLMKKRKLA